MPQVLIDLSKWLSQYAPQLSNQTRDGRINSAFNEDEIINIISTKYSFPTGYVLRRAQIRDWFDMAIENRDTHEFYPINIKVTRTHSADNLNCKLGVYYALTGCMPDFGNEVQWAPYIQKLRENLDKNTSKDYYFLIVNKDRKSDIFCNSLKGISSLQPNGNNLPFQCKWDDNRTYRDCTHEVAKEKILKIFSESIKLRAEIYFIFKKYFPQYVEC